MGTQTPLFRSRTEALAKGSAAIAARQQIPFADRSDEALVPAVGRGVPTAENLAVRAHGAAVRGETQRCLLLIWALKDLPREKSVQQALDKPRIYQKVNMVKDDPDKAGSPAKRVKQDFPWNTTLLQAVSAAGMTESLDLLLELRPQTNLKDAGGRSALHMAACGNLPGVARSLMASGGANVDARDAKGKTPLRLAVDRGHTEMVRLLMHWGANPHTAAGDKKSAHTSSKCKEYKTGFKTSNFMRKHWERREAIAERIGRVKTFKALGTKLPAHIVAPPLKLAAVGYCPEEDGEVVQLKRGIRNNKRRSGPSNPPGLVNWYSPRG